MEHRPPVFLCSRLRRGRALRLGWCQPRLAPPPFCGVGEKRKRLYCFFYIRAACVQRPPYEIRQPLHSRPYCSGALGFLPPRRHAGSGKASLAPCALAGDPLAPIVCGRRMCAVVTTGAAHPASPRLCRGKPAIAVIPRPRSSPFVSVHVRSCCASYCCLPSKAHRRDGGSATRARVSAPGRAACRVRAKWSRRRCGCPARWGGCCRSTDRAAPWE